MSPDRKALYERAKEVGSDRLQALGLVVMVGMLTIRQIEVYAGKLDENTYQTHFPLDEETWELTLTKKAP